jgi:hypothetical protein
MLIAAKVYRALVSSAREVSIDESFLQHGRKCETEIAVLEEDNAQAARSYSIA